MDPFAALLTPLLALVALGLGVWTLRRSRGLERRLFLLLLGASLVPSLVVLATAVQGTQRSLELLDAPGLRSSLDAALGLARATLVARDARLQAAADSLVGVGDALTARPSGVEAVPHLSWAVVGTDGRLLARRGSVDPTWLRAELDRPRGGGIERREHAGGEVLVTVRQREDASLVVADQLPPRLVADLQAVEAGSRGLAQVRLYYAELLRARALLIAASSSMAVLLLSILASRWLSRRLAAPVAELVEGTRRVAAGDLDHRVRIEAPAEVGELVGAFNAMTEELADSHARLRRSERIAAWQGIARRLAHEIKNPLTPIHLSLHRLRRNSEDPVLREGLDTILEETRNLQRLADEFSLLARLPEPRRHAVQARPVLEQVCDLYVPEGVRCTWAGWDELPSLDADEGQLRQVLGNLVKNAVEAMGGRGSLELRARATAEAVQFEIIDDGPGMPEPVETLFEPEFTTKGSGTGLGLAIVRRIVEDHGGHVEGRRVEPRGSCFRVRWPRHPDGPRSTAPGASA